MLSLRLILWKGFVLVDELCRLIRFYYLLVVTLFCECNADERKLMLRSDALLPSLTASD